MRHTAPKKAKSTQRNWIVLNLSSFLISCYHDSPIPSFNIKQFFQLCVYLWRCFAFAFKTSKYGHLLLGTVATSFLS